MKLLEQSLFVRDNTLSGHPPQPFPLSWDKL